MLDYANPCCRLDQPVLSPAVDGPAVRHLYRLLYPIFPSSNHSSAGSSIRLVSVASCPADRAQERTRTIMCYRAMPSSRQTRIRRKPSHRINLTHWPGAVTNTFCARKTIAASPRISLSCRKRLSRASPGPTSRGQLRPRQSDGDRHCLRIEHLRADFSVCLYFTCNFKV